MKKNILVHTNFWIVSAIESEKKNLFDEKKQSTAISKKKSKCLSNLHWIPSWMKQIN